MTTTVTVQTVQHDDGEVTRTVRHWSVYEQRWVESLPGRVPDRELAAMTDEGRAVVAAAVRS